ncbi:MAG: cytochrome b5 [Deltaproteobacteria bacterium]|nr:cytochrome b5 [Deltaproteobacteria bacterium]
MRQIDKKELTANDGRGGRPLWVAHRGRVFDLSTSSLWEGGSHMGSHSAGGDLTDEINAAPHGPEMLERFPRIGTLKGDEGPVSVSTSPAKEGISTRPGSHLLTRFPVLKRHPHPMTVHFPIVLGIFAPVFIVLFFIFRVPGFELTSFYCLGAGLIFVPIAMITGYITWRINYGGHRMKAVTIKITLSIILLIIFAAAFIWRLHVPGIVEHLSGASVMYFLLVLLLVPLVVTIGWYGATLTFPLTKPKR